MRLKGLFGQVYIFNRYCIPCRRVGDPCGCLNITVDNPNRYCCHICQRLNIPYCQCYNKPDVPFELNDKLYATPSGVKSLIE